MSWGDVMARGATSEPTCHQHAKHKKTSSHLRMCWKGCPAVNTAPRLPPAPPARPDTPVQCAKGSTEHSRPSGVQDSASICFKPNSGILRKPVQVRAGSTQALGSTTESEVSWRRCRPAGRCPEGAKRRLSQEGRSAQQPWPECRPD